MNIFRECSASRLFDLQYGEERKYLKGQRKYMVMYRINHYNGYSLRIPTSSKTYHNSGIEIEYGTYGVTSFKDIYLSFPYINMNNKYGSEA